MIDVLNTRPESQAAELSELLNQNGYHPVEIPLVELVLISEGLATLTRLSSDEYDGILLSSPNLIPLLVEMNAPVLKKLAAKEWYLISKQAQFQVEAIGGKVAFVPKNASLEGFYKEFPARAGLRILHICSRVTRLDPKLFLERGITVRNLPMYTPHCPTGVASQLQVVWPQLRAVLFASGSAVQNLFTADTQRAKTLGSEKGPLPISIGPSATEALLAEGIENFRQAETADNAGLVAALNKEFQNPPQEELSES